MVEDGSESLDYKSQGWHVCSVSPLPIGSPERKVVNPRSESPVEYADLNDGFVVIRVQGRGTHLHAPCLDYILRRYKAGQSSPRFIFDLGHCTMMDSTFMGVLASMGIHQWKSSQSRLVVTNIRDHVRELLDTLGLKHIVEMRGADMTNDDRSTDITFFEPVTTPDLSRRDRILMMLEAHQKLIDIDSKNEVKFENVIKQLQDGLKDERDD